VVTPQQSLSIGSNGGRASATEVTPVQGAQSQQAAALGEALGNTGAQTFRLTREMQRDFDNAKFQEASARYAEMLANTEAEFDQLVGDQAHQNFDRMRDKLATRRTELEKNLTSSEQRRAFGLDASTRQTATLNRMNARRADQLRVYRIGAASASLDQAMRDRVNAGVKGDTTDYIRQSMVMHRKLTQLAELNGFSEEQVAAATDKAEDTVSVSIVEGLLDAGAVARAGNFLESIDGRIQDPVKKAKLEQRIRTAGIKQQADALVPGVRKHAPGDLLEQRSLIQEMDVPVEVKDELLRRVRGFISEDRAEVQYRRTEAMGQATEHALRGEELPEKLETELRDLGMLEQARNAMANVTTPQGEVVMETITGAQLRAFETPESLINAYAHELSVSDRRRLRAMWDRTMGEELQLRMKASEQAGGSLGKRSTYADKAADTDALLDLDDVIDQHLVDLYPDRWGGVNMSSDAAMGPELAQSRRQLRTKVRIEAGKLARVAGRKKPTDQDVMTATREVLKVRASGATGMFYDDPDRPLFGLSSEELEKANVSFNFSDGRTAQFNLARQAPPGSSVASVAAKDRMLQARQQLIELGTPQTLAYLVGAPKGHSVRSIGAKDGVEQFGVFDAQGERVKLSSELGTADNTIKPQLVRQAQDMTPSYVTDTDVMRKLALDEYNARQEGRKAAPILDEGQPLPAELEAMVGPAQQERSKGYATLRSQWSSALSNYLYLEGDKLNVTRDDEAFMRFWPSFEKLFGKQLKAAYGSAFPHNSDDFRRAVIDSLFSGAPAEDRHLLWVWSGRQGQSAPSVLTAHRYPKGVPAARPGAGAHWGAPSEEEFQRAYLEQNPAGIRFTYDLNGTKKQ